MTHADALALIDVLKGIQGVLIVMASVLGAIAGSIIVKRFDR